MSFHSYHNQVRTLNFNLKKLELVQRGLRREIIQYIWEGGIFFHYCVKQKKSNPLQTSVSFPYAKFGAPTLILVTMKGHEKLLGDKSLTLLTFMEYSYCILCGI